MLEHILACSTRFSLVGGSHGNTLAGERHACNTNTKKLIIDYVLRAPGNESLTRSHGMCFKVNDILWYSKSIPLKYFNSKHIYNII